MNRDLQGNNNKNNNNNNHKNKKIYQNIPLEVPVELQMMYQKFEVQLKELLKQYPQYPQTSIH